MWATTSWRLLNGAIRGRTKIQTDGQTRPRQCAFISHFSNGTQQVPNPTVMYTHRHSSGLRNTASNYYGRQREAVAADFNESADASEQLLRWLAENKGQVKTHRDSQPELCDTKLEALTARARRCLGSRGRQFVAIRKRNTPRYRAQCALRAVWL
jgi:hypothetical protein